MAKFLRIGVHHKNVSGYTSKAWSVRRVGSNVLLKWGAVEVDGTGPNRRVYWIPPYQHKTVRCRTETRAREYVKKAIAKRLNHRYERLNDSVPIRQRAMRHTVEADRMLATMLIVDIVRSTEKAARLGDHRWTNVMNHYYATVRRELQSARGKEVVTTGDGMVARFDVPARAIRCAAAIRDAVRTLGLEVRAGLHTGEYKQIGDEVVGLAIHIGARVAARAAANEVLVSSAVRELVVQSTLRFQDRGLHTLKGVPERWRLYRVET